MLRGGGVRCVLVTDTSRPAPAALLDGWDEVVSAGAAGDVTALQLDIDFDDAGFLPGTTPFGDVTLCSVLLLPALNGLSVRAFASLANTLLGGGTGPYTIADIEGVASALTDAFPGGAVSPFAHDHLVVGACP